MRVVVLKDGDGAWDGVSIGLGPVETQALLATLMQNPEVNRFTAQLVLALSDTLVAAGLIDGPDVPSAEGLRRELGR